MRISIAYASNGGPGRYLRLPDGRYFTANLAEAGIFKINILP